MLKTRILCFVNNYITGHNKFRNYQQQAVWETFPYHKKRFCNKRNKIKAQLAELRNIRFDIKGQDNSIEFGNTTRMINGGISVVGNNNRIVVGDGCGLYGVTMVIFGDNTNITIGNNTHFFSDYQGVYIGAGYGANVNIGDNCLFAPDVFIRADDAHKIIDISDGTIVNQGKDVIIEEHVWVGSKNILLKGVHIEHDCVISPESLLTKGQYEANTV